jgi:hypothetical protein
MICRMRFFTFSLAALVLASPALAADKRVFRVDSLIATQKDGTVLVQAKGAVQSGGWTRPHLHVMHSDGHTVTLEFLAAAPPPGMTVIEALVPVVASLSIKARAASVHVLADENEITSQVLR